ncbi:Uncharacterized protein TCM_003436 [Theobroma cacao]|uniref:Uncharacterized protein n=1 Tax=Theobroma cacao TaxID=3641 RepID=A0A061DP24_THECC|nr:Uncharacterized protein TCM_003436 [Theobroma cacao]
MAYDFLKNLACAKIILILGYQGYLVLGLSQSNSPRLLKSNVRINHIFILKTQPFLDVSGVHHHEVVRHDMNSIHISGDTVRASLIEPVASLHHGGFLSSPPWLPLFITVASFLPFLSKSITKNLIFSPFLLPFSALKSADFQLNFQQQNSSILAAQAVQFSAQIGSKQLQFFCIIFLHKLATTSSNFFAQFFCTNWQQTAPIFYIQNQP